MPEGRGPGGAEQVPRASAQKVSMGMIKSGVGKQIAVLLLGLLCAGLAPPATLAYDMAQRGRDLHRRLLQGATLTAVAFGDSLTDGMGTDGRHSFPRLFGDCLKYRYPQSDIRWVVHGHPGATTADALGRVEAEVLQEKPQLVLVQFGGNDKGWGRALRDFRADYGRLLTQVATQTEALVIACLNPIVDENPDNAWSAAGREVASGLGIPAADLDAALRRGDHDFRGAFPWGSHPGDFTHAIMAREVLRAFDEATGAVPDFTCGLVTGSQLSTAPLYELRARLRNLTEAPLDCTVRLDYPDQAHDEHVTLRPGGSETLRVGMPLQPPAPGRSYSVPVHLWARSEGYGGFDVAWLVVAPAISAIPADASGRATAPVTWQRLGAEALMFGRHLWLGPTDLSARFCVLALPDRLRVDVQVSDDDLTIADLNDASRGDSLELYLDLRGDRDQGKPVYSQDVVLLQILAPAAPDQPPQWKGMHELPTDLGGLSVSTQRTAEGYRVQVEVPLTAIEARRGKNWGGLGFDVGVNDADFGGSRKTQMMWAGMPDNYLNAAYLAGLYRDPVPEGATRRTLR